MIVPLKLYVYGDSLKFLRSGVNTIVLVQIINVITTDEYIRTYNVC